MSEQEKSTSGGPSRSASWFPRTLLNTIPKLIADGAKTAFASDNPHAGGSSRCPLQHIPYDRGGLLALQISIPRPPSSLGSLTYNFHDIGEFRDRRVLEVLDFSDEDAPMVTDEEVGRLTFINFIANRVGKGRLGITSLS